MPLNSSVSVRAEVENDREASSIESVFDRCRLLHGTFWFVSKRTHVSRNPIPQLHLGSRGLRPSRGLSPPIFLLDC